MLSRAGAECTGTRGEAAGFSASGRNVSDRLMLTRISQRTLRDDETRSMHRA